MPGPGLATIQTQYLPQPHHGHQRAPNTLHAVGTDAYRGHRHLEGHGRLSNQYALPVRPSPVQNPSNASYSSQPQELNEHQLRRKTPAGTIDAAYDATSSTSIVHATKHLIVSNPPHSFPSRDPALHSSQDLRHDAIPNNLSRFHHAQAGYFQPNSQPCQLSNHVSTNQPFTNFDATTGQSYHLYPQHNLRYEGSAVEIPPHYYQPASNDQYIPMVAHPPTYPPLPPQSTATYGSNAPNMHRMPWHWVHHSSGFPASQQSQNGQNLTPMDLYSQRGPIDHMPLLTLQKRSDNMNDLSPLDLGKSGLQSFAERSAKIPHFNPSASHAFELNLDPRANNDPLWSTVSNHQSVPASPYSPTLEEVQRALYQSYTCYASLVSIIQKANKVLNASSRQQAQTLQIYPEATRKQYYRHDFAHQSYSSSWRYKQANRQTDPFPSAPSSPSEILPEWIIDAHRSGSLVNSDISLDGLVLGSSHNALRQRQGWPRSILASADALNSIKNAQNALDNITMLICDAKAPWLDGMQMAGSLAFILGDYSISYKWFCQILNNDSNHAEATANLGVVMIACGQRQEAEYYWRLALHIQPDYFDAAEQLVTLLCHDHRHKEAIKAVEYVQQALTIAPMTRPALGLNGLQDTRQYTKHLEPLGGFPSPDVNPYTKDKLESHTSQQRPEYMVQDPELGRMMALIHAKGNIQYSLHDQSAAAQAFEEVVLIATGIRSGGLKALIDFIHSRLADQKVPEIRSSREPFLLSPEKALSTAKICFGADGNLPGMRRISNAAFRKSAISCISNSLLSLAKIYQDGISSLSETPQRVYRAGIHGILVLYYLSLSLQPSPSTANNVGILLANVQQPSVANKSTQPAQNETFMFPGVVAGSGVALALTYYQYGLSLDSKHAHLFTNLGSLLKDIGQLSLAIKMYEKAVACDGNFDIALANLANAVKDQGKTAEAITYYKRAVQVNPNFAEAVCGLANALNSICDWAGRGGVMMPDGAFDRWHVDTAGGLQDARTVGNITPGWIQRVFEIVESQLVAGESWGCGLLQPDYIELMMQQFVSVGLLPRDFEAYRRHPLRQLLSSWHSSKWEGARIVRLVERATKQVQWRWYRERWVRGRESSSSAYARPQLPASLSTPTAPTVLPFHTFTFPMTAKQVRLISQRNALRVSCMMLRSTWLPKTVFPPPAPPKPCLHVGYVSSDFNNHPLAHLMQSVFGMHDTRRVKAFCYATTASDKSVYRQKIESEAPVFYDASNWSLEQLVQQIVQDGIHVLVNLNGYTRGARNEVFAARPAPIQMSFMGFAGSLGAEWCDYLLADEVAIPSKTLRPWRRNVDLQDLSKDENNGGNNVDWVYSENIIYTRDTFFCCDHRQSSSSTEMHGMTWEEEQARRLAMRRQLFPDLPENAVIFGNFNQLYKIDPTTFRTWLRILSRVPNSILWLLRFPEAGEQHLRDTATAWGGQDIASRIVFTDVAPKAIHIARACVADLFLDTPECNAHTTAADCLWSGTPILTLPRYEWKMCSRMAAGILGGALPKHTSEGKKAWKELVVGSEEEYEATAIRLGTGLRYLSGATKEQSKVQGRLVDLRKMLWDYRWESKLFDTQRWVSDLELAYQEAWRRWVSGEGGDIWLKDLI